MLVVLLINICINSNMQIYVLIVYLVMHVCVVLVVLRINLNIRINMLTFTLIIVGCMCVCVYYVNVVVC